mmetsp:Transcript_158914/g.509721  ORF Transcript_158914/g.509721 Transcript_158914/m.509721 type:complete len:83 (+) Transcript_158914:387-635(+)
MSWLACFSQCRLATKPAMQQNRQRHRMLTTAPAKLVREEEKGYWTCRRTIFKMPESLQSPGTCAGKGEFACVFERCAAAIED